MFVSKLVFSYCGQFHCINNFFLFFCKGNEINNLILNIKKILKFSISKGGSSIRDFQNALGKSGNFQQFFHVYGRKNKNCSRISCTGKIKKIVIANRSSFYCNRCQI